VVKHRLRDASKEKTADHAESSGSENDEVDIAPARDPHDFLCRSSVHHQSLDWRSSFPEDCGGIRQHVLDVRLLLPSVLAVWLVWQCSDPTVKAGNGRPLAHVQEADAGVAQELEDRQETERGARALGAVDGHQNVPHLPRSTPDDRDGAGRVPGDGQRRASDKESLHGAETSGSEHSHVHAHVLRHADDLHLGIALRHKRVDRGPPSTQDLRRPLTSLASLCHDAVPQFPHGLRITGRLR
jgi:hypothetical protein